MIDAPHAPVAAAPLQGAAASRGVPPALHAVMQAGKAHERLGRRDAARAVYRAALEDGSARNAAERAQLHRWIARNHMEDSDYAAAEAQARQALALSESVNDEQGRGQAINTLAAIRWSHADLDEAEALFLLARESATACGDASLCAMTATNLGNIAAVRGDDVKARRFHESALADARAAGLADSAMKALNNLGLLHTHMRRYAEAARAFDECVEISGVLGALGASIMARLNIARLQIRQGDFVRARAAADAAMTLNARIHDAEAQAEAEHIYGMIARASGDASAAEAHLLAAEATAVQRQNLILQGETARELAELYRDQGRNRETLQRLNQAHRLFEQLRARRELADVDRRTAQLEAEFLEVVRKWGDSIESKDMYTQGHCVRVADLACALWARVNAADDTSLFWFRIGALLHDVGKLMVPAEVLNKAGKLTPEEWEMVRRHPAAGVELLADIDFPWDVRPLVESHHERWDGRGYPHGLAGEAIPFAARVLCIADVYDALTSERSYKSAYTHSEAMALMRVEVGRQFDPVLFEAFEEVMRGGARRAPASAPTR